MSVTIVIATAGETAEVIANKMRNTLRLQPAPDEILLFSDGYPLADATEQFPGVRFLEFPKLGKTACQNGCVKQAQGDIIVFTDVTAEVAPDAIGKLLRWYGDRRVGAVGGLFSYNFADANVEGSYVANECRLKRLQSTFGATIGYFGPLYSVRKTSYTPMPDFYCSDLMLPLCVIDRGELAIMDFEARAERQLARRMELEFERKRRIVAQAFASTMHFMLVRPTFVFRHPMAFSLLMAFKIVRWIFPLLLLMVLGAVACFEWRAALLASAVASLSVLASAVVVKLRLRLSPLHWPYYVWLVAAAATLGVFDATIGRRYVDWEPGAR